MTNRIFKSIFSVACGMLVVCLLLIISILYPTFESQFKNEIKQQAYIIARGVEVEGIDFFSNNMVGNHRITWIDPSGKVVYDNMADVDQLENHIDRQEVQDALASSSGESERYSTTLAQKTLYYAVALKDGSVLRIAAKTQSVYAVLLSLLGPMFLVLCVMVLASGLLAKKLSKRIVDPINQIDLNTPLECQTYEELSPFLSKIAQQNNLIEEKLDELKKQQKEFKVITENMQEGLVLLNAQGKILSTNSIAEQLLKIEKEDENRSIFMVNRSKELRNAVEKVLNGEHDEEQLVMDGRSYRLLANPVFHSMELAGAVLVFIDDTEKVERESLRREFSANVSHELKTPLTSISGYAEIIKNGIVKSEDIPAFAGKIYDESQRLISMVKDIIKLSQFDENAIDLQKTEVNLKPLAMNCLIQLQGLADQNSITLDCNLNNEFVMGVSSMLEEMVTNLVENGIKYNRLNGYVKVSLYDKDESVYLSVEDNGIGIPFADQQRVFERFYRVDKSHSKTIDGTGLGLSIVKHGAIFHDAKIEMKSEENQGTKITLIFPKVK